MSRQTFEVTALEDTFYRVLAGKRYKVPKVTNVTRYQKLPRQRSWGSLRRKKTLLPALGYPPILVMPSDYK